MQTIAANVLHQRLAQPHLEHETANVSKMQTSATCKRQQNANVSKMQTSAKYKHQPGRGSIDKPPHV